MKTVNKYIQKGKNVGTRISRKKDLKNKTI
jgi:hypothetical protein